MIFSTPILTALIAIFLQTSPSHAQSNNKPWQHLKNQWTIQDLTIGIFNKTVSRSETGFKVYRTNYEECVHGDATGIFESQQVPCGYLSNNFPVQCGYPTEADVTTNGLMFKSKWATCDTYPAGAEGERDVSETAKQWLKWRASDLQEYAEKDRALGPSGLLFRSVKFTVVHGVPQKQENPSAPAMVKTFSTTWTLNGNETTCANDTRLGGSDMDMAYSCQQRGNPPGKPGRVTCSGQGFFFAGTMGCKFSADVVEETITVSVFKERYT